MGDLLGETEPEGDLLGEIVGAAVLEFEMEGVDDFEAEGVLVTEGVWVGVGVKDRLPDLVGVGRAEREAVWEKEREGEGVEVWDLVTEEVGVMLGAALEAETLGLGLGVAGATLWQRSPTETILFNN